MASPLKSSNSNFNSNTNPAVSDENTSVNANTACEAHQQQPIVAVRRPIAPVNVPTTQPMMANDNQSSSTGDNSNHFSSGSQHSQQTFSSDQPPRAHHQAHHHHPGTSNSVPHRQHHAVSRSHGTDGTSTTATPPSANHCKYHNFAWDHLPSLLHSFIEEGFVFEAYFGDHETLEKKSKSKAKKTLEDTSTRTVKKSDTEVMEDVRNTDMPIPAAPLLSLVSPSPIETTRAVYGSNSTPTRQTTDRTVGSDSGGRSSEGAASIARNASISTTGDSSNTTNSLVSSILGKLDDFAKRQQEASGKAKLSDLQQHSSPHVLKTKLTPSLAVDTEPDDAISSTTGAVLGSPIPTPSTLSTLVTPLPVIASTAGENDKLFYQPPHVPNILDLPSLDEASRTSALPAPLPSPSPLLQSILEQYARAQRDLTGNFENETLQISSRELIAGGVLGFAYAKNFSNAVPAVVDLMLTTVIDPHDSDALRHLLSDYPFRLRPFYFRFSTREVRRMIKNHTIASVKDLAGVSQTSPEASSPQMIDSAKTNSSISVTTARSAAVGSPMSAAHNLPIEVLRDGRDVSEEETRRRISPTYLPMFAIKPPPISIKDYYVRLLSHMRCSPECYIYSLCLLQKVAKQKRVIVTRRSIHRLIFASLMVSAKMRNDKYYSVSFYARAGGMPANEARDLERLFVLALDYDCNVPPLSYLEMILSLRQHCSDLMYHKRTPWAGAAWSEVLQWLLLPSRSSLHGQFIYRLSRHHCSPPAFAASDVFGSSDNAATSLLSPVGAKLPSLNPLNNPVILSGNASPNQQRISEDASSLTSFFNIVEDRKEGRCNSSASTKINSNSRDLLNPEDLSRAKSAGGGPVRGCRAGSNAGSYHSSTTDHMLTATHTHADHASTGTYNHNRHDSMSTNATATFAYPQGRENSSQSRSRTTARANTSSSAHVSDNQPNSRQSDVLSCPSQPPSSITNEDGGPTPASNKQTGRSSNFSSLNTNVAPVEGHRNDASTKSGEMASSATTKEVPDSQPRNAVNSSPNLNTLSELARQKRRTAATFRRKIAVHTHHSHSHGGHGYGGSRHHLLYTPMLSRNGGTNSGGTITNDRNVSVEATTSSTMSKSNRHRYGDQSNPGVDSPIVQSIRTELPLTKKQLKRASKEAISVDDQKKERTFTKIVYTPSKNPDADKAHQASVNPLEPDHHSHYQTTVYNLASERSTSGPPHPMSVIPKDEEKIVAHSNFAHKIMPTDGATPPPTKSSAQANDESNVFQQPDILGIEADYTGGFAFVMISPSTDGSMGGSGFALQKLSPYARNRNMHPGAQIVGFPTWAPPNIHYATASTTTTDTYTGTSGTITSGNTGPRGLGGSNVGFPNAVEGFDSGPSRGSSVSRGGTHRVPRSLHPYEFPRESGAPMNSTTDGYSVSTMENSNQQYSSAPALSSPVEYLSPTSIFRSPQPAHPTSFWHPSLTMSSLPPVYPNKSDPVNPPSQSQVSTGRPPFADPNQFQRMHNSFAPTYICSAPQEHYPQMSSAGLAAPPPPSAQQQSPQGPKTARPDLCRNIHFSRRNKVPTAVISRGGQSSANTFATPTIPRSSLSPDEQSSTPNPNRKSLDAGNSSNTTGTTNSGGALQARANSSTFPMTQKSVRSSLNIASPTAKQGTTATPSPSMSNTGPLQQSLSQNLSREIIGEFNKSTTSNNKQTSADRSLSPVDSLSEEQQRALKVFTAEEMMTLVVGQSKSGEHHHHGKKLHHNGDRQNKASAKEETTRRQALSKDVVSYLDPARSMLPDLYAGDAMHRNVPAYTNDIFEEPPKRTLEKNNNNDTNTGIPTNQHSVHIQSLPLPVPSSSLLPVAGATSSSGTCSSSNSAQRM